MALLKPAANTLSNVLLSKILHKPSHEAALVTFGTTGTDNALNRELIASSGDDTQYTNITEEFTLGLPTMEYIARLKELQSAKEEGASDFVNAITVAADLIQKRIKESAVLEKDNVTKRIVLVTDLLSPAEDDDEDWSFTSGLVQTLQALKCELKVVCIDTPQDTEQQGAKDKNRRIFGRILPKVPHRLQHVRSPAEMRGAFPFVETSATAYYSGPLTIAGKLTIEVKATKKSCQEKLPSLSKYSDVGHASHEVEYSSQLVKGEEGKEEEIVPSDARQRAYLYGNQLVPLSSTEEKNSQYNCEVKTFQVLGSVPLDAVPRHLYFKDTWLVAPAKDSSQSFAALSALANALERQKSGLLARFLPRANAEVGIGFLTPHFAHVGGPANDFEGLVMNMLPFEEDYKWATFASFEAKEKLLPSKAEVAAMGALIDARSLDTGRHEQLPPSLAPNPALRSFLDVLTELSVDSNAAISVEHFPKELNFVEASEAALKADQDVQSLFPDLKTRKIKAKE